MNISTIQAAFAPQGVRIFMTTAYNGANFSRQTAASRTWDKILLEQHNLSRLVTLHQIHSADIVEINDVNYSIVDGVSADGLVTADSNIALGVLTADCYPVFLVGNKLLAALHCGWRGTVKGIIPHAKSYFDKMQDKLLYAYVGAGISKGAFEVKEDFIADVSSYIEPSKYLTYSGGKYCFDLPGLITDHLSDAGVELIETANRCTATDNDFYSYRRDKDSRRMMSVIVRDL